MSQTFLEYFRCPEDFGVFCLPPSDESAAGFFRFGEAAVGYAPVSCATGAFGAGTPDVLEACCIDGDTVVLPFDPSFAANALRHESYAGKPASGIAADLVRRLYYAVRPLLPVVARRHLQRLALRDWKSISFPSWPVDTSVDALMNEIMRLVALAHDGQPVPFIWFWPDDHQAACIMTHDVETASGRDFCPKLMDITSQHGFRSSFQVVPEDRYEVPASYRKDIISRGFELNLHGLNHDGNLFREREEFLRRANKINSYARRWGSRGFRSPVLYRNSTWMSELDFEYDMSFPNVAHLDPQRGGCCTVKPYMFHELVELPLTTTQDYTLFHILRDCSLDLWRQQIEITVENHGLVSFIVHPDYITTAKTLHLYESLLETLSEKACRNKLWCALPGEVASWWRDRSQMRLEATPSGEWRVTGPNADRASLALASLDGNALGFTVRPPRTVEGAGSGAVLSAVNAVGAV